MTRYADAARDYLRILQEATADRPPHSTYLADLISAMNDGDDLWEVPVPHGVSGRVVEALVDDLYWIDSALKFEESDQGMRLAVFPNSYRQRRQTDARAATARARTQNSLEHLLSLGGNGDGHD